jgi:hypothetical protein
MKPINKNWLFLLAFPFATASAAPDAPAQLASLTSMNLAMVSSALSTHQKGTNDIAATRAAHIVSINRLSIDARQESDREVSILKQTGGTEILKVYSALCEHGDNAALASGQAAAAEAAAKSDVTAAYTPLAISTDKLDKAAKTLAGLAKEQSTEDRLKFLLQFAKDVRDESAKLEKASEAKKADADKKLDAAVEAVSAAAPKVN